jgi:hypothetical protein
MSAIFASTKQAVLHTVFDLFINMVFNVCIIQFYWENTMSDDKKLIEELGGPSKLCELLGYAKHGGRGIPPKVKLERPELFLNRASESVNTEASASDSVLPQ